MLRRDGRIVSELDLYDFLVQGDKSRDIQLAAGDVVVLQTAGAHVAVTGAIDSPAIYELKGDDLKITFNGPDQPRPKTFAEAGAMALVLKRAKGKE